MLACAIGSFPTCRAADAPAPKPPEKQKTTTHADASAGGDLLHPVPPGGHTTGTVGPDRQQGNDLVRTGQFFFPRLQFQCHESVPDKWDVHLIGDQKLRDAVKKLTNVNILTDLVVVNLDKPDELCQYPFVFMTSEGEFDFSDSNVKALREYLLRGGFLYADDCVLNQSNVAGSGDRFYTSFIQQMARVFPENPMRPVPNDHEIFNCFFKLPRVPYTQGVDHPAMGLFDKETGRLMCMVTSGDIHCGWVGFGNLNRTACTQSIQLGVNIVIYALTH
jgi:hypothetical protein